jgi:hypothetical protein
MEEWMEGDKNMEGIIERKLEMIFFITIERLYTIYARKSVNGDITKCGSEKNMVVTSTNELFVTIKKRLSVFVVYLKCISLNHCVL